MCFLFQVRINLNEKNDVATIKAYLTTDLEGKGPESTRKGKRRPILKRPKRAFGEINTRIREKSFGDRPSIPNICLLLVNDEKNSKYLKKSGLKKSGLDTFCDHTLVFSGEDEVDLETIRKKICPESQIIRGKCDLVLGGCGHRRLQTFALEGASGGERQKYGAN